MLSDKEKAVIYLIVEKKMKTTSAVKIIYPELKRARQKAYELSHDPEWLSLFEKAQKREIDTTTLLSDFYRHFLEKRKDTRNITEKAFQIAREYAFSEKKVRPTLLISDTNEVRKELVKIYLNPNFSNELRLRALDMLARSLNMYAERTTSINLNLNANLSQEQTERLLQNYLENLKQKKQLPNEPSPKEPKE
jgi:tRNA nucleotidyltransferase/poly(A) polymerase